jgi:hypothetical protein
LVADQTATQINPASTLPNFRLADTAYLLVSFLHRQAAGLTMTASPSGPVNEAIMVAVQVWACAFV